MGESLQKYLVWLTCYFLNLPISYGEKKISGLTRKSKNLLFFCDTALTFLL